MLGLHRRRPKAATRLELAFWDTIKDSTDPADFQAYLAQFPNGTFAALARIRVIRLGGDAGQAAADQGASQTQVSPQANGCRLSLRRKRL